MTNKFLQDHIEHYRKDAEEFDYFHVDNPHLREEERRRMELLIGQMRIKAGEIVLDAGSGGGWVTKTYLPKGVFVCAADLSMKNLREIRLRFDPERKASYVVADLYHLPFKQERFDAATSNDVYEHLEHLDSAARELRRVVKRNGSGFVSAPYKENILYFLCIHCNKLTPINAHLHSLDEKNLGDLFQRNGFEVVRVTKFMNKGLALLQVYYRFCRWMPFRLWRAIDIAANFIVRKPGRMAIKLRAVGEIK
jgi:ubiquinone/menaquinone biosynthesis C-methylase UbiE